MAKFLDLEGLNYFWEKIKSWVLERFAYKSDLNQKLEKLRSGQNIKTINNLDILGSGNIEILGGSSAVLSVNEKTGNVVLSASDVGAVPTERTINGKALSSNITLNASDVNALPSSTTIPTKVSDLNNDLNFSSVSIDKKVLTGTNIADITIDGTTTLLYAPQGGSGSGEENLIESISVNGTAQTITNKNVDITVPTTLASLSDDATHRVVTDTEKSTWSGKSNFSGSYNDLTDKPTLFSGNYNDLSNKPTIPTVPTNVSAFNNDAGYLTSQDISGKENTSNKVTSFQSTPDDTHYPSEKLVKDSLDAKQDIIDSSHKLSADLISDGTTNKVINVKPDWNAASGTDAEILNKPTIPAAGIPSGGNAGQVLKKVSADPYDVTWANQSETLPSAYCTTRGDTAAKIANCSLYVAQANQYLQVLIGSANTYQGALTLNINSAGAKPIYINGTVSSLSNYTLPNGTYFVFYDGTNYYFRTDGKIQGPSGTLYIKPSTGIPASDLASGTVPVQDVTVGGTSVVSSGTAVIPAIPDKVVVVDASTLPSTLDPNKVYQMGTLTGTINIPEFTSIASGDTEAKIWCFTFNTSTTAPNINWPTGISKWAGGNLPTINASKYYEVTAMDGIGVIIESSAVSS